MNGVIDFCSIKFIFNIWSIRLNYLIYTCGTVFFLIFISTYTDRIVIIIINIDNGLLSVIDFRLYLNGVDIQK